MFVVALLFPQTRHDSLFWNLGKGGLELGKFDIPPDQTTRGRRSGTDQIDSRRDKPLANVSIMHICLASQLTFVFG